MFKIGDFSRIARVSCRLLRYYDDLGLFRPAIVDGASSYRFYSATQLPQLNRILVLKELGFSLQQITRMIAADIAPAELRAMLLVRRSDVARALAAESERLRQIEARIAQLDVGDSPAEGVMIRAEPAHRILSMRQTVGSFAEVRATIRRLVTLPSKVPENALGPMIGIAHSPEFELDVFDVELGYVLRAEADATRWAELDVPLRVRELPSVRHLAACVRVGLPEHAHRITAAIGAFAEANGYVLAGPSREVFVDPPSIERMEEAVVEMQFPLAARDPAGEKS